MGCCTRFRTTWWPGYSADVIDPDKAFNFQRRVSIIKRVLVGAAVLALICGAIYLLAMLIKGNGSKAANTTNSTLPEKQALKEESPLQVAGVLQTNQSTPKKEASNFTSSEEEMIAGILESNGTKDADDNDEKPWKKGEFALFKIIGLNSSNDVVVGTETNFTKHKNHDGVKKQERNFTNSGNSSVSQEHRPLVHNSSQPTEGTSRNHSLAFQESSGNGSVTVSANNSRNASEDWCKSKGNILKCVALSKDFKSVTTFPNRDSPRNHTGRVAGYVMVKRNDSRWRPYCTQTWSLHTANTLCEELGFKNLYQLQIIEISELKQRVREIGHEMSLSFEQSNPTEKEGIGSDKAENSSECQAGYVICDPY